MYAREREVVSSRSILCVRGLFRGVGVGGWVVGGGINKQNKERLYLLLITSERTWFDVLACITDETGRPLLSSLSELVNKRFSKKLPHSKMKATLEKYLKPANCSRLNVALVNNEIWKTMPKQSNRTDLQHTQIQKLIVKGASAVVLLVCFLSSWRCTVIPESLVLLLDGIYSPKMKGANWLKIIIMSSGDITGEHLQSLE